MSDEDFEGQIEAALDRVLDRRDAIDRETHARHHRFMEQWIQKQEEKEQRRQQIIDRVKGTVVGAGILAVLGWMLSNLEKLGRIAGFLMGGGK